MPNEMLVRAFPYPFESALTIVSDVDGASRARYEGYVGDIVRKLGLDFGDSTWLRTSCESKPSDAPIAYGLGFFSRHFGLGDSEDVRTLTRTRTLIESLVEYHVGNLDHFHAFVSRGPRVAVLEKGDATATGVAFSLTKVETEGFWRSGDIYVDAVNVITRGECTVRQIALTERDGRRTEFGRQVPAPKGEPGVRQTMLTVASAVADDHPHPRLDNIARVDVDFAASAPEFVAVLLVSGSNAVILDRLKVLRERFNVETPLVSEHSGLHFRSTEMSARRDAAQEEYLASHKGVVAPLNGAHRRRELGMVFSTDADDPGSVARLLPELCRDFEVRFLIPKAATSNTGWPGEKLVVPLSTRAGTVVYQVHRTLPNLGEPADGKMFDGTPSRQENFMARLGRVLDASEKTVGLYWPIYTHLGGITQPTADAALSSPYFKGDELNRLQDRVYNISGSIAAEARIWMSRSSTFYDYALIRRSIAEHVTVPNADTVEISSWHDPVLNKILPRSPAQLYGLTFYVDDAARAAVLLDGRPIELLSRNAPDQTGRFSVTVCEAEIKNLVFDALDPLKRAACEAILANGKWRFVQAETGKPAHGRLTVVRAGSATLRIPMHGWCAVGSQLLSMIGRRSSGAFMALTLETASGGRFFFGDRPLLDVVKPVTAQYIFEHERGGALRPMVAPFHCLDWAPGAATGGPMPSHALTSITLYCTGRRGAWADFGSLALLRPRATSLYQGDAAHYCLGGTVPGFTASQAVFVQPSGSNEVFTVRVDQRGRFCFTNLAEGIYSVWTEDTAGKIYDRRGPLVELGCNMMTLELGRQNRGETRA